MFNQNKKRSEIRPAKQKGKLGVVTNKDAETKPRDDKDNKQARAEMQSEGGQN